MRTFEINPAKIDFDKKNKWLVPIGVSNHHLHLSQEHIDALFGPGHQLTVYRQLSQPGEFAAAETVNVVGSKGVIEKVRIIGPARKKTQVELSRTDAKRIGVDAPIRNSGDVEGSPGLVLVGPRGAVVLEEGCIIPRSHIHMHPKDADKLDIRDGDKVSVLIKGTKVVCYHDVLARVSDKMHLEFHMDTDEANAAFVDSGDLAMIKHKEIVVKDNFGNIIEVHVDDIKFVQGRKPSDYVSQEGIRLLRTVFEYPASVQREINEKLLHPEKLDPNKFYLLTAMADDKVIGIATFYFLEDVNLGYLEHIGIIPEYRGRGIGSFFYHKVQSFLEKEHPDIEGLFLEVRGDEDGLDNRKGFFLNLGAIPVDTTFYPTDRFKQTGKLMLMFRPLVMNTSFNTGTLERAFRSLTKVL